LARMEYAESQAEWYVAHASQARVPLHDYAADLGIPDCLSDLVMAMLEKDRTRRPADGAEVIQRIEACEGEIPSAAQPSHVLSRAPGDRPVTSTTTVPGFYEGWRVGRNLSRVRDCTPRRFSRPSATVHAPL